VDGGDNRWTCGGGGRGTMELCVCVRERERERERERDEMDSFILKRVFFKKNLGQWRAQKCATHPTWPKICHVAVSHVDNSPRG
jgi:hypothetical protein